MRDAPDSHGDERGTGRRSVLKAGIAGLTTLTASGTTVLAATNRSDKASDVYTATGAVDSPVSEKQRRAARKQAVGEYERNTGETIDGIPASRPTAGSRAEGTAESDGEDAQIVAFAYGVDADGIPREYVGMASESDEVETKSRAKGLLHDRFEDRVRDISTALEASDSDVTTQATGGTINNLDNMEETYNSQLEYANDPYGVVSSTYYWLEDTSNNDEGSVHGFHSPMTIEPGYQVYGSGWKNELAWNKHRWDKNQMAWHDVGDGYWKPAGPSDGGSVSTTHTVSVTVGWMTADISYGYSWGYTEPAMERTDQSSQYNGYNQWKWDVQDRCDGSVRKSTLSMQPSSTCDMEDYDCSMGRRDICENEVKARFTSNCSGDWHELWTTSMFYKEC